MKYFQQFCSRLIQPSFVAKSIIVLLLFSSLLAKGQTGIFVPELAVYDVRMTNILQKYQLAGAQLAITHQGRLVYNRGFGYADVATKSLVQPNTIFRLASVSKAITSVAIMHLVEKNMLKLDDKVFGAKGILHNIPYQKTADSRMFDITVRQLLSHSAGFKYIFPADPLFQTYNIAIAMGTPPPTDSVELAIQWALENTVLDYAPGTSAVYTNFAYAVLGKVIEETTGQDYEEFVQKTILLPIEVTDMHAGRTLLKDKLPREATYYDYPGAPLSTSIYTGIPNSVPAQYGGYNWEIMTPAGGWVASAQDLCKLLVAVDRFPTKPDVLLPATIDTMTRQSRHWSSYALGWNVGGNDYWHTGGIQGTATVVHRNAEHQLNWAVVFNSLPADYGPFYTEFMALVLAEFSTIPIWPKHDLFQPLSDVQETNNLKTATIFPNPTNGLFSIRCNANIQTISICNALGEIMHSDSQGGNQNDKTIDLSRFQKGVYSVKVYDGNRYYSEKIVVY